MKNTYLIRLTKTLLFVTIGMLLSVNTWAHTPQSLTETRIEEKLALHSSLKTAHRDSDKEVKESKEWTAATKHIDTKNITTYSRKDGMDIIAEVAAYREK